MLLHIVDRAHWEASTAAGEHTGSTRDTDLAQAGFIHLCTDVQVGGVLERFYAGVDDLLVLHVDESRLTAPVVFEPAPGTTELFPHLYGPLNLDAVVATSSVPRR